jgi:hypothetical protein
VVPSSHALSEKNINTIAIAIAAVVVVGLIGWFMYKNNKNKLRVDEVKARLDAGQTDDEVDDAVETETESSSSESEAVAH